MIAFRYEKAMRCSMCGTAAWEWDPKQGGRKFAYEAVGVECKTCAVKEVAQEESQKLPGFTIEVRPTGTRQWAQMQVKRRFRERRRAREKKED